MWKRLSYIFYLVETRRAFSHVVRLEIEGKIKIKEIIYMEA